MSLYDVLLTLSEWITRISKLSSIYLQLESCLPTWTLFWSFLFQMVKAGLALGMFGGSQKFVNDSVGLYTK